MAQLVIKVDTKSGVAEVKKLDKAIDKLDKTAKTTTDKSQASFNRLASTMRGMVGIVGTVGAAFAAGSIIRGAVQTADAYSRVNSQLGLVVDGAEELASVQAELYAISQQTGTALLANSQAYAGLALGIKSLNVPTVELLSITKLLNQSLIVAGASGAEASSFMLQFKQAMASGVLQGDEFRAVMESNAYFGQKLAEALDTDVAGLRAMSKQGELTSSVLRDAMKGMAGDIDEDFQGMTKTVERAMNEIKNAFDAIVSETDTASGGTNALAESLSEMATTISENKDDIISFLSQSVKLMTEMAGLAIRIGASFVEWGSIDKEATGVSAFYENLKKNLIDAINPLAVVNAYGESADAVQAFFDSVSGNVDTSGIDELVSSVEGFTDALISESENAAGSAGGSIAKMSEESIKEFDKMGAAAQRAFEKAQREVDKFASKMASSLSKMDDQEFQIELSLLSDDQAQAAMLTKAKELEAAAAKGASTGTMGWKSQLSLMEQARSIYLDMNSNSEKVSKSDVAAAKKKLEYYKRISRSGKAIGTDKEFKRLVVEYAKLKKLEKEGSADPAKEKAAQEEKLRMLKANRAEIEIISKKQLNALNEEATKIGELAGEYGEIKTAIEVAAAASGAEVSAMHSQWATEIADLKTDYEDLLSIQGQIGSSVPGRAVGGPVNRGDQYMVGEKGPELFTPQRSGYIVPNDQLQKSGDTMNINFSLGGDKPVVLQGSKQSAQDLQRMFSRHQRLASA